MRYVAAVEVRVVRPLGPYLRLFLMKSYFGAYGSSDGQKEVNIRELERARGLGGEVEGRLPLRMLGSLG